MSTPSARFRAHAVLLAGGSGTRFWPYSRQRRPKQLLPLAGKESLLRQTWRRVRDMVPPTRIWVVAPDRLKRAVRSELPELRRDRLVLEPSPRDTAPAIALAAVHVGASDPNAVMGVFPTDHAVADAAAFARSFERAISEARRGSLVCLGVRPDRPATGFGYLRCARRPGALESVPVERFVEKPPLRDARRFLRSGRYLWNAGMFVWRPDAFLNELARVAPDIHDPVVRYVGGDRAAWGKATRRSVDFAVMEHAERVAVVPLDAGWDDVGSWDAAARLRPETSMDGASRMFVDSPGAAVFGDDRLVAVVGLPDVVVVDTEDAVLVVPRGASERVREVVERLRGKNEDRL